ncbi:hypothetical protein BDV27DRAFT_130353 [Aspergillus caelatus]|uniref:Zn(2)-C6 fungal-type domain-containing protein n=1 Tax=Aspergillus caelatus TaxID=61420 RepID=A0A5N6ZZZ3_9EURO|nr:uncharacterized protein BDV27DRAFT_130353 [Aspergillus caelatus]KAE8363167.1 hypothetical protein BDV27DRAFT_130353 [Aspergillus caelatus]
MSNNDTSLTFLEVNQTRSPGGEKLKRGYQSCDNCREKKKKCEPSSKQGSTCLRCEQELKVCSTTYQRKRRKLQTSTCGIQDLASCQGRILH